MISTKVWDRAGIELATPGYYDVQNISDNLIALATWPSTSIEPSIFRKTRGPMGPGSLTWIVARLRGCLPHNITLKSILGITQIISKLLMSYVLVLQQLTVFWWKHLQSHKSLLYGFFTQICPANCLSYYLICFKIWFLQRRANLSISDGEFHLRNGFDFWNVNGIMNTLGLLQSNSGVINFARDQKFSWFHE